jgi:hypothetical protein
VGSCRRKRRSMCFGVVVDQMIGLSGSHIEKHILFEFIISH